MKVSKLIVNCLALAALAVGVTACGKGNADKEGKSDVNTNLSFESFQFDYVAQADTTDSVEGAKFIHLKSEGVLPRDLGSANIKTLRDSLLAMSGVTFTGEDSVDPKLPEGYSLTDAMPDSVDSCDEDYSRISLALVNPRIAVFEVSVYDYPYHAAHGMTTESYLNYDLTAGRILGLQDLLVKGYEKKLAELVRADVKAMNVSLLGNLSDMQPSAQFAMTSNGLMFSYNPYEIAPYSEGVVKVEVSLDQLVEANLLSPLGKSLFNL